MVDGGSLVFPPSTICYQRNVIVQDLFLRSDTSVCSKTSAQRLNRISLIKPVPFHPLPFAFAWSINAG
jgi:hypothetical protein